MNIRSLLTGPVLLPVLLGTVLSSIYHLHIKREPASTVGRVTETRAGNPEFHSFLRGCHHRNAAGECFNSVGEAIEYLPYESMAYEFINMNIARTEVTHGCSIVLDFSAKVACREGLKPLPLVLHAFRNHYPEYVFEDCRVEWDTDSLHALSFSCPKFNNGTSVEREYFGEFLRTQMRGHL